MSSVIVKGMEMPDSCYHCKIAESCRHYITNYSNRRPNDCPLIALPDKHGKWIYLDKDKRFFHPHIVKCSVCDNTLDMYGVNAGRGDANFCPNCGAPIESTQCPYCGTVFYDFTVMDSETPTYIRINWYGQQIVFRALMRSVDITTYSDSSPVYLDEHYKIVESRARHAMDATIEFMILPDDDGVLMKRTELKGENGCQST